MTRRRRSGIRDDSGQLMVAVVSMLAIGMILATVAAQEWRSVLRRELEAEMIFRGEDLVRSIYRFQQDQGRLPNELDELLDAGSKGQYFVRKEYTDPLVVDGKWGLLYAAPGGAIYDPSRPDAQSPDQIGGRSSAPLAGQGGLVGGQQQGGPQATAGLGIIGVKSLCTETPFRVRNGIQDYGQWLFTVYDLQRLQGGGGSTVGQPGGGGPGSQGRGKGPQRGPGRPPGRVN